MSLRDTIHKAVRASSAGQHLAEVGIESITDSVMEGLQTSGPEGIAEFAKLALTAPERKTRAKPKTKTSSTSNSAKGQGSKIRGAVARIMRGEPRSGDEKLLRGDKERALVFADRYGKNEEQKRLIASIVSGDGKPSGFPSVES